MRCSLPAIVLLLGCGVPGGGLGGDASRSDGAVDAPATDAPTADVPIDVPRLDTCMEEVCNGFDDDCDGLFDETCPCTSESTQACGCEGTQLCVDGMWAECMGGRAPTPERCNGVDDDCNGMIDDEATDAELWFVDSDDDGYGDRMMATRSCTPVADHVDNPDDCDDGNASINPAADELCGGPDEDCDMRFDEDAGTIYYRDADGDGFGNASMAMRSCTMPVGSVADGTDCDDMCELCYPGFPGEICGDGNDNDCDPGTDEGDACECFVGDTPSGLYLVCDDIQRDWADARTYCMARGGDLVSINSSAEQDDVWTLMDPSGDSFWIGGEDTGDGDWEWVDGTAYADCDGSGSSDCSCLTYCNWRSGRPDGGDCAWIEHNRDGTWDDKNCDEGHEFVCEL